MTKLQTEKRYGCSFLQEGLAGYSDESMKIYLKNETIAKMADSYCGKPVMIKHKGEGDDVKRGVVTSVEYDASLNWWVLTFYTDDKKVSQKIDEEGWVVSCAYEAVYGEGGSHNGIEYDYEVIGGTFDHLAIVPNPRYEEVQIWKLNSGDDIMKSGDIIKGTIGKILIV